MARGLCWYPVLGLLKFCDPLPALGAVITESEFSSSCSKKLSLGRPSFQPALPEITAQRVLLCLTVSEPLRVDSHLRSPHVPPGTSLPLFMCFSSTLPAEPLFPLNTWVLKHTGTSYESYTWKRLPSLPSCEALHLSEGPGRAKCSDPPPGPAPAP